MNRYGTDPPEDAASRPDELLVAAKVEIRGDTGAQIAAEIDRIENRVRTAVPIARVIYIESDVFHD